MATELILIRKILKPAMVDVYEDLRGVAHSIFP